MADATGLLREPFSESTPVFNCIDMALRNQPYIPLYVHDFISDEKLRECRAASVGVYIMLMCVLHKCEHYGFMPAPNLPYDLPWQNEWQKNNFAITEDEKNAMMFAIKLSKHLPFSVDEIKDALVDLASHKVIQMTSEYLSQKRMMKDNELSLKRSTSGKKGAKNKWEKP